MFELIYTSAPRGLIAGRSGFSTVAVTDGFPPNLISAIENMSGYKTLFQPGDPNEKSNPVNYSCQHYFSGSTRYTVLSKIAFAGLSYTGRTNILAHHLIFTREEFGVLPHGAAPILHAANCVCWHRNNCMISIMKIPPDVPAHGHGGATVLSAQSGRRQDFGEPPANPLFWHLTR